MTGEIRAADPGDGRYRQRQRIYLPHRGLGSVLVCGFQDLRGHLCPATLRLPFSSALCSPCLLRPANLAAHSA